MKKLLIATLASTALLVMLSGCKLGGNDPVVKDKPVVHEAERSVQHEAEAELPITTTIEPSKGE